MAVFVALLRAVNVGGNTLKMERVRELCEDLGFSSVKTYLQSGNVVFQSKSPAKVLSTLLEHKLVGETRLPVSVLIRSPAHLEQVLSQNPFEVGAARESSSACASGPVSLYVSFLSHAPTAANVKTLMSLETRFEQIRVAGKEVYLHLSRGAGESKMSNTVIEKVLGMQTTMRNWNTVRALYELASGAR